MTPGLIYLICFVSVVMLMGLLTAFYLWGKGNLDIAGCVLLVFVVIALSGGVMPGSFSHVNRKNVDKAEALFQQHCDGYFLDWERRDTDEFRYRWVDSENKLRETIIFVNPWGKTVEWEITFGEER